MPRDCVFMEPSHEGATGKDSLSPWWGPGCGSRFYRHVSHLFGPEVLGGEGQCVCHSSAERRGGAQTLQPSCLGLNPGVIPDQLCQRAC